jgi:copper chaperone NosL
MATRRAFLALLGSAGAVGVAVVAGVQLLPGESLPTGDPVIRYGQENCARCRMTISDARFAAAWRSPDGKEKRFDDIGCMVLLQSEAPPPGGTRFWVHDFATEAWIDGEAAVYIVSATIPSPMAYGVAASATAEGAAALARRFAGTELVQWQGLGASLGKRG